MEDIVLKKRTILVIIITILMMIAEIFFGFITNSMALTADGFHMGTHALAFIVTLIVCIVAIKNTGKAKQINSLGGFISAVLLGLTALAIIWESLDRFITPIEISFEEAILVAVIGLVVNLVCIFIMGGDCHIHMDGKFSHEHCHCSHCHEKEEKEEEQTNLNFKAAYMHILADILTSVMAIIGLLLAKYLDLKFLDPIIGYIGGIIIIKWSIDLIKASYKDVLPLLERCYSLFTSNK